MLLLKDPYLDLAHQYIETERCVIVPLSTNTSIDVREYLKEYSKFNKKNGITDSITDSYDELENLNKNISHMRNDDRFDNFILNSETGNLLGGVSLNTANEESIHITVWIRDEEEGRGYRMEICDAIIHWCRINTTYKFLIYTVHIKSNEENRLIQKYCGKLGDGDTLQGSSVFHIPL